MLNRYQNHVKAELAKIADAGTFKNERVITSAQGPLVSVRDGRKVINLCANNYLGLAQHPEVISAAHRALDEWGYGLASVRFICGTQSLHRQLEEKLSEFLGTEDTILYSSCFDANGGLFEVLLGPEDAIFSDALNHASIIDGIRLCKARRFRYSNNDVGELEQQLRSASDARFKLIATDGVFSMDGYLAKLDEICDVAERHGALVMIDDSHAVGFIGKNGRGSHEHWDVMSRVAIVTGTLGKALGGASGGYTSGPKEVVQLLRQRSRPYLFSNTVAPAILGGSLKALEILTRSSGLRDRLNDNTKFFRHGLEQLGFRVLPGSHPICPIMLEDAVLATSFSNALLECGVYAVGFSYPVVPSGRARIRTQMSAAHSRDDLKAALEAFEKVGEDLGVL